MGEDGWEMLIGGCRYEKVWHGYEVRNSVKLP
jgi:hypothetical protein